MKTEAELLEAWRAGDRAAGQALFSRYFQPIRLFFVNKIEGSPSDLVQETFMACIKGRDRIHEGGDFRAYLFGVAYRVLRVHLRSKYRAELDLGTASMQDLAPSAVTLILKSEQTRLLAQALRILPVDLQVVMELRYWEQMNSSEIAQVLGISASTVRYHLRQGRSQLADAIRQLAKNPKVLESTLGDIEGWAQQIRDLLRSSHD
ncbi:MAG: sigma-70 family RNA polymerase sigma factor [Myxococcota bacterium]